MSWIRSSAQKGNTNVSSDISKLFVQLRDPPNTITSATLDQLSSFIGFKGTSVSVDIYNSHHQVPMPNTLFYNRNPRIWPVYWSNITIQVFCTEGPKLVLAIKSQKYFIIFNRYAVRKLIFSCVQCTRVEATHPKLIMGNLSSRVQSYWPFQYIWNGLWGSFISEGNTRKKYQNHKSVFSLIHLKLISMPFLPTCR